MEGAESASALGSASASALGSISTSTSSTAAPEPSAPPVEKILQDERYGTDIASKYELLETIGQGTFGVVRKCRHRGTGQIHAVKTILKNKVPDLNLLRREVDLLSDVDHPHIIRLFDVYEEGKQIHLVTELCTGGELYDRVVEKSLSPEHHFSEYDAARILRNILEAIRYCHDVKGIVHRDLKVENFLLLHDGDEAPVKIIDFGLGKRVTGDIMTSRVGTVYYVAPEVLSAEEYTNKCDVWSIGVIAYVLLCGFPPFYASNELLTLKLVKEAPVEFPSPIWDDVSVPARQFILRLLQRDPAQRPTAQQALQDPWLQHEHVQPLGVSRWASFLPRVAGVGNNSTSQATKDSNSDRAQKGKHPQDSAPTPSTQAAVASVPLSKSDDGQDQHHQRHHHPPDAVRHHLDSATNTTTHSIQMKNRRREGFHRFLMRIKVRKQLSTTLFPRPHETGRA